MKYIKKNKLILEKSDNVILSLLRKTVKNGATTEEAESSYQKALELIKKNNIKIENLNIDDIEIKNRLEKDLKESDYTLKEPHETKKISEFTIEDFVKWTDSNYSKIEEVGFHIEKYIKSTPILNKYYFSDHWEYEDDNGEMIKEPRDDGQGGWDYSSVDSEKLIEFNFPFEFMNSQTLPQLSKFLETLNGFCNTLSVANGEQNKKIYFNQGIMKLELYLTIDDLYSNIQKLQLSK